MDDVSRRTGVAAVVAGAAFFAGQGGELAFGTPERWVHLLFVIAASVGLVALGVAVWGLRTLVSGPRVARVGLALALAGCVLLTLFAAQVLVWVARTGEVPDNFVLFALGFLLVLVGQVLLVPGIRDLVPPWARPLPVVASAGLVVALGTEADPWHDIGLFVFQAAWIGFGVALLRRPASVATA